MPEIIAERAFSPLYIALDSIFLVLLCALLLFKKKYLTLLFGLCGGILYFLVDYGIFHLWLHTRTISGGSLFWVLLWMSMSYGITNFVLIWVWLNKDKHAREWTFLVLLWWFVCPLFASAFGSGETIHIQRTTGAYHAYMAMILFASYLGMIIYNLFNEKEKRFPLLWLLAIGVGVQFGWEFSLLLGGIRSAGITDFTQKLHVLTVNSLLETNLGIPLIYLIYLTITARISEDLKWRPLPLSLRERLLENKRDRYRDKAVANII